MTLVKNWNISTIGVDIAFLWWYFPFDFNELTTGGGPMF